MNCLKYPKFSLRKKHFKKIRILPAQILRKIVDMGLVYKVQEIFQRMSSKNYNSLLSGKPKNNKTKIEEKIYMRLSLGKMKNKCS